MTYSHAFDSTSLGRVLAVADDHGLCALEFLDDDLAADEALARIRRRIGTKTVERDSPVLDVAFRAIDAYLRTGVLDLAIGVRLAPRGTPFQVAVWEALRAIPDGSTRTYAGLCRVLGHPVAMSRAVGAACGANPIAVLVPCHRVVSSSGGLGGYRWGLERKRALLVLEGDNVCRRFP